MTVRATQVNVRANAGLSLFDRTDSNFTVGGTLGTALSFGSPYSPQSFSDRLTLPLAATYQRFNQNNLALFETGVGLYGDRMHGSARVKAGHTFGGNENGGVVMAGVGGEYIIPFIYGESTDLIGFEVSTVVYSGDSGIARGTTYLTVGTSLPAWFFSGGCGFLCGAGF